MAVKVFFSLILSCFASQEQVSYWVYCAFLPPDASALVQHLLWRRVCHIDVLCPND